MENIFDLGTQDEYYEGIPESGINLAQGTIFSYVSTDEVVRNDVVERIRGLFPENGVLLSIGEGRGHVAADLGLLGYRVRAVDRNKKNTDPSIQAVFFKNTA